MFVRSRAELDRARAAVTRVGLEPFDLSERDEAPSGRIPVGTTGGCRVAPPPSHCRVLSCCAIHLSVLRRAQPSLRPF